MKKIFLTLIFLLFAIKISASEVDLTELRLVVFNYIDHLDNLYNKNQYDKSLGWVLEESTEDIKINNDLIKLNSIQLSNGEEGKINLSDYYDILERYDYKIRGEITPIDPKFMPINYECPIISDKTNGKKLMLVSVEKKITFKNETKILEMFIGVNVSKRGNYRVSFTYFREVVNNDYPQNSCNNKTNIDSKNNKEEKDYSFIMKDRADKAFERGEYILARNFYKQALEYNKYDQDLKDGINNCNHFIKENQKDVIKNLINKGNYKDAKKELLNIKDPALSSSEWHKKSLIKCNEGIEKKNNNKELLLADILFRQDRFKKALTAYQNLTALRFLDQSYIASQIKKCKEADPQFIEKKLGKAYNDAVKSKNNWLSTFKTYYKYENSGYLKASQFYFMMQMMLDKKHSRIGKPMGFSRNKMNLLAKKYFYEAKNRGYDVSYVENHIFTQSINKYKK